MSFPESVDRPQGSCLGCAISTCLIFGILAYVFGVIVPQWFNPQIKLPLTNYDGRADTGDMAKHEIKKHIITQLKTPGSADFNALDVVYIGDGKYNFKGNVDASNSFGKIVRTNFRGTIKKNSSDQWDCLSLFFF